MKKENINCNNNTPSPALRASSPSRGEGNDSCSLPPWRGKVAESRMRGWPSGFTLIELLVVVLIIGILAAVALPQYQKAVVKTKYATLKHLVKNIVTAQQVYYLANGKYTQSFEELDVDLPEENAEESTPDNHAYSWGNCYLYLNGQGNPTVACINNKIHMQYSTSLPAAATSCWVFAPTENDLTNYEQQKKICQQETQSITEPGKGYMFFNNQRYHRWSY